MTLFVVSVSCVLVISAACSLTEAALYAVRMPFISKLVEGGSTAGKILDRFKQDMGSPIAAILIVNTAANTAGAAIAGAQARQLFGEGSLFLFSACFTLAVLFFSEILPKVAGVAYHRNIAPLVSFPLHAVVSLLYPLVWLTQRASGLLERDIPAPFAPEEEVEHMARLSAREGSILKFESELVKNVLDLDRIKARDILTPRTVVFKLDGSATIQSVADEVSASPHARIPVYEGNDQENWRSVVLRADILAALAKDQFVTKVAALANPLGFVPETMPAHLLLNHFIKSRAHLLGVVDEYGAILGIVTMEDVFESLIGREILDETDKEVDMQAVARRRGASDFAKRMKDIPPSPTSS